MKKKKYNPFKMFGSWLGFIFLPLSIIINSISKDCVGNIIFGMNCTRNWSNLLSSRWLELFTVDPGMGQTLGVVIFAWIVFFIIGIFGFLIGWGIHSFFRRLSK